MEQALPQYIEQAKPVPNSARTLWHKSTFPTYAGIFLWVGFYLKLAEPTIGFASVGLCLLALLIAGLLCFGLYYYAPAMLGLQTGTPLYVVGSSTFGTTGGYLIPGILMGLLQMGWVSVVGAVSANFIMKGLNQTSKALFVAIVVIWIYSLGWVAIKGIKYVGRIAKFSSWIPLIMIVFVFFANKGGIQNYHPAHDEPLTGFLNVLTIVIGFFATAGAAGADFGMNNARKKDIVLGGLYGIVGGAVVAGGLSILSVAGYIGSHPGTTNYDYSVAIASTGSLAPIMFFLFAAASVVPTCFSSFIASNSFSTMLPKIPRAISTFAALTVCVVLAATGIADNLVGFFGIVAASFSPICGAMLADYVLSGGHWSGPRAGINWAGYLAWIVGFLVGIPEHIPRLPQGLLKLDNPSGLYSLIVGFLVYFLLAKLGFLPRTVAVSFAPQITYDD